MADKTLTIRITGDASGLKAALSGVEKTLAENKAGFQALGASLTAFGGAVIGALGLSAKAAVDLESAFAGVRKTVNASQPELQKMREQFLKMSTEIPVSAASLSELGQVAGQLGIRKENVVGFSRVIADLGVATNLAGSEGAAMLAQFGNIVKLPQEQYSNLGSAIVDLGNNSATTERDIAAMALRLAAAGSQAGLSAPEILGLSASLASVGIEAEAGGTAFSQLLIKMLKATKEGGTSLTQFAQVAGVTSEQFKKSFETNASGALIKFLKGVDDLNKSGANTFGILESMGVEGVRLTDAVTRAANANDLFEKSIKRGTTAFQENTALSKEAAERYKTVESQLVLLGNATKELAIRIGDAVLPALRSFVDVAKPIVSMISDWAKENPNLTTSIVAVGGALGGLALTVGPLLYALPSLVEGFVLAKGAILATGPAVTGLVASLGGLGAIAGYTALIVAATAAIGGIVYAFMSWRDAVHGWEDANKGLDSVINKLNAQLKLVGKEVERGNLSWEEWTKKVQEAAKENAGLINKLGEQERAQKKASSATTASIPSASALAIKTKEHAEAAAKAKKEIEGYGSALGVTIPKLKQAVVDGEKYVAYLKKSGASAEEVKEAETKLNEARTKLTAATSQAIQASLKLIEATKDLDKVEISNIGTLKDSARAANDLLAVLDDMGVVVGTELPSDFGKPKTAVLDLNAAFKTLGITSTATLQTLADEAEAAYNSVRDNGKSSARDVELAQAASIQAQINLMKSLGEQVPPIMQKTVDDINAKWGNVKEVSGGHIKGLGAIWQNQVSTIITDFGKGIADILLEGGKFKDKMSEIFKEAGKSIVRMFTEFGISKLEGVFKNLLDKVGGWFGGLFDKILGGIGDIGSKAGSGGGGSGAGGAGGSGTWKDLLKGGLLSAGIGLAITGLGAIFGKIFGPDKDKLADTEVVEKGWPEIWKLQGAYAESPVESPQTEEARRTAILGAGVEGWNQMVGAFKRPESKDSQRKYIFDFIDAVNKTFTSRISGFTDFSPGPLTLPVQPMARGGRGVVSEPTLFLAGERGPERYDFQPMGSGMSGPAIQQTNHFYRVAEDEYTLRKMQERSNANFVDLLARGG